MSGSPLPTTRFAPSPTGRLHLGSAYAALVAHQAARDQDGHFLLRLEDIDTARCRPEFADAILDDLRWLGLVWDGPVRIQSEHLPDYQAALARLAAKGLLYPCFCTRADIAAAGSAPHMSPSGPDGPVYPGTCRHLDPAIVAARQAAGDRHALRLDMAEACRRAGPLTCMERGEGRLGCDPSPFGDVVLARKDTPASYHLCVTHDDALQGVTLVTRAADLRPATAVHRLLQALLDWPEPEYAHHALLRDANGNRLAKRDAATSIGSLRAAGLSPDQVVAQMAALKGSSAPPGRP